MNICVFCSANDLAEKYTAPAVRFGKLLAEHGHSLVWGGSDRGLMKLIASTVQENGGKIIGVSMRLLEEAARKDATEMIIEEDLSARKATLLARSDALAVLVGGLGTLDEITEVLELKKHRLHEKKIVVLNTDDFYSGFRDQLERMNAEGFLPRPLSEFLYIAKTPEEALAYLEGAAN